MIKYLFNKCMKFIGITLILFFLLLYLMIFYSFIYDLCQIYYVYYERSLPVILSMMAVGYYLAFCIFFNYAMAIFVHPGKSTAVKKPRNYQLNGLDDSDDEDDEPNNFRNLQTNKARICRKCNDYKPLRAHHCSICNECVYKMDHHCPWLDSCVGYENHRYFLSFIFYLMIAMIYISMLFAYIDNNPIGFKEAKQLHTRIYPAVRLLSYVLGFVLVVFNSWNWYLAITGYTAIEFWGKRTDSKDPKEFSFAYPTARENLYQIFGTRSYFKMLLPSITNLPHDGTKWEINQVSISTARRDLGDIEEQQQTRNRKNINNDDHNDEYDEEEQKFDSFNRNYVRNNNDLYNEDDIDGGL